MSGIGILSAFSKLIITSSAASQAHIGLGLRSISTHGSPLFFKATSCLYAEPLKKKKKLDPAIVKQRDDRRRKKIEKQIRRLERNARQLKPIDELDVPLKLIDEREARLRTIPPITADVEEQRALLAKDWARYKSKQHLQDLQMIDRLLFSQQKALDELRNESEELYQEAIQIDSTLIPYSAEGPVWTPPISNYESPDGEYINTSKKWE